MEITEQEDKELEKGLMDVMTNIVTRAIKDKLHREISFRLRGYMYEGLGKLLKDEMKVEIVNYDAFKKSIVVEVKFQRPDTRL